MEELNLDQLIENAISQVKKQAKETEKVAVVDVTIGQTVVKLWTLNKRTAIVAPKSEKLEEIIKLLSEGKIVIVEVEKDTLVQRRNIIRVLGGMELPEEKLLHVSVEPDRTAIKLTLEGMILRPDPFSFNTQRLIEAYESGTSEVRVLPVAVDSRGRCYGIQWIPVRMEKYLPKDEGVQPTINTKELLNNEDIVKLQIKKEEVKG